jgi:chromosome segregation ATPase
MNSLEDQIQKVRELRIALEAKTQEHHELQVAFNQQHKDLIEALCRARNDCAEEEARLRDLTLEAYHDTGSKKPAPGVGIRIVKQLHYDEAEALAWAIERGAEGCLSLQKTNFKKVAEGLELDFVMIEEIPQATIAREL